MSNEKKLPVITIGREYGSGGHEIARKLSERLGIPFYDKDIVRTVSKESGYTEDDVYEQGEHISRAERWFENFLDNGAPLAYNINTYDQIYTAQKAVILRFAKEPCIICGRCADKILKEAGIPSFNVFIYADIDHRVERAKVQYGIEKDVVKSVLKKDRRRAEYYKLFTGSTWGDYRNYSMMLDSGVLGEDECVNVLADVIREKYLT